MAQRFTFQGTVTVTNPYEVTVLANSYEEAQEAVLTYVEDRVPEGDFHGSSEHIEIEIDSYESFPIR